MQVNYYFRNSSESNFSIENVFGAVIKVMRNFFVVTVYHTRTPVDLHSIFVIRKFKADIHHITGAVNYLAFGLPGDRTVITVHDIGHYTETLRGWRKVIYKYLFWIFPLKKVKAITTISAFTKEQLIKHFNVPANKITVIPNPVNPAFTFIDQKKNERPVILQIGSGRNKNIEKLIDAAKGLDVKLLLIRPSDAALVETLTSCHISFEFRSNLSEIELIQAYADADIVYFASTYEGFGLPILEGMAIGRPVITSNISPLKDIAHENAVLVDPSDAGAIRVAIKMLVENREVYQHYQQNGLKHVELFRVEKIAAQYQELYQRLISE
jgi:glycosyltransferase involved in cell wall biosynthesis